MIAATSSIGLLYFILYTRIDIDMFFFQNSLNERANTKVVGDCISHAIHACVCYSI